LREIDRLANDLDRLSADRTGLSDEARGLSGDLWGLSDVIGCLSDENFVCRATDKRLSVADTPLTASVSRERRRGGATRATDKA